MTLSSKTIILLLSSIFSILVVISSCKKDDEDDDDTEPLSTDAQLYNMAIEPSGFTWYKNSATPLPKSNSSGHSEPLLRTRYNAVAATKLGTDGKVMAGTTFPEGSLIVKELLNSDESISLYAILYKQSGNEDADADGWVWGYIRPNGEVAISATEKGTGCRGCHSQNGSIDFTLMNIAFP